MMLNIGMNDVETNDRRESIQNADIRRMNTVGRNEYRFIPESVNYYVSAFDILYLDLLVSRHVNPIQAVCRMPYTINDLYVLMESATSSYEDYSIKFITYHILFISTDARQLFNSNSVSIICTELRPRFVKWLNLLKYIIEAYNSWEANRLTYIKKIRKMYYEKPLFDRLLAGRLIRETQFHNYFNSISEYSVPEISEEMNTKRLKILYIFLYNIKSDCSYSALHMDFITRLFTQLFDTLYPRLNEIYLNGRREVEFEYA